MTLYTWRIVKHVKMQSCILFFVCTHIVCSVRFRQGVATKAKEDSDTLGGQTKTSSKPFKLVPGKVAHWWKISGRYTDKDKNSYSLSLGDNHEASVTFVGNMTFNGRLDDDTLSLGGRKGTLTPTQNIVFDNGAVWKKKSDTRRRRRIDKYLGAYKKYADAINDVRATNWCSKFTKQYNNDHPNRSLHFVFSSWMGTELAVAYPIMEKLQKEYKVDVSFVTRVGFGKGIRGDNMLGILGKGGLKGISESAENKFNEKYGINVVNYDHLDFSEHFFRTYLQKPVDLFIVDWWFEQSDTSEKTRYLARHCDVPMLYWAGNEQAVWHALEEKYISKGKMMSEKIYPSFVASFSGAIDTPPVYLKDKVGKAKIEQLGAPYDTRWKSFQGLRLAGVRAEVAPGGVASPDQEYELQKVISKIEDKELVVYFVLGTQSLTVAQKGYWALLDDLKTVLQSTKALIYFVIPAPHQWSKKKFGEWKASIDQKANAKLVDKWVEWVKWPSMPDHLDSTFVFTTFSPQQLLFDRMSAAGKKIIMVNSMGGGSLNEAVDSLIPVVGVPYGVDQPWNSLFMQKMGAGIDRSSIIDDMKKKKTFYPPGVAIGAGLHTSMFGPFQVMNLREKGFNNATNLGTTLADAVAIINREYEDYKANVAKVKEYRNTHTLSQDEVARDLVYMVGHEGQTPPGQSAVGHDGQVWYGTS